MFSVIGFFMFCVGVAVVVAAKRAQEQAEIELAVEEFAGRAREALRESPFTKQ